MGAFDFRILDGANFRQRVLSALAIAPLALLAVHLGGWIYALTVTSIVTLGLREWLRLVDPGASTRVTVFSYLSLFVIMGLGARVSAAFGAMSGTVLMLVLFLLAARERQDRAGWVALGLPYMAGSGLALLYLRATPDAGRDIVYYLLASVWGTDIGAYLAGRLIGGPKLVPEISPGKTWAGLFGGMALAAAFGYAAGAWLGARQAAVAAALALVLACVAQMGDIFESYFKRRAGVKDSGDLIPGHGGVLDRIDGLVFAAVFFVLFQIACGARMQWW